jgi:hypothetical protein
VGGPSLQFRDAANPDAEPIFVLHDKDEVHRWEYLEGVHRHLDRLLGVAPRPCGVWGMPPRYDRPVVFLRGFLGVFFPRLFNLFVFSGCVQELKEYSRRKSLFIRDESGMWVALSQQRVLVEEAQKQLSDQNAEMAKLRVVYAVVKEEAMQAWAAEAVMRTGMDKAQEEAAQARRDLEPLSRRVKELEENVS